MFYRLKLNCDFTLNLQLKWRNICIFVVTQTLHITCILTHFIRLFFVLHLFNARFASIYEISFNAVPYVYKFKQKQFISHHMKLNENTSFVNGILHVHFTNKSVFFSWNSAKSIFVLPSFCLVKKMRKKKNKTYVRVVINVVIFVPSIHIDFAINRM